MIRIIMLILCSIIITGCSVGCITYPERLTDDNGNMMEPDSCFDYRVCMYFVARGKYKSDCKLEFEKCCKERNYDYCNDLKNRWEGDSPQNCWDKLD